MLTVCLYYSFYRFDQLIIEENKDKNTIVYLVFELAQTTLRQYRGNYKLNPMETRVIDFFLVRLLACLFGSFIFNTFVDVYVPDIVWIGILPHRRRHTQRFEAGQYTAG